MIDIQLLRQSPDIIVSDLKKRGLDPAVVARLASLDEENRSLIHRVEELKSRRNDLTKSISSLKSSGRSISSTLKEVSELPEKIADLERKLQRVDAEFSPAFAALPNILHRSVPSGADDSENVEVRRWGRLPAFSFEAKGHQDIAGSSIDIERAGRLSGSRFYFLKGDLFLLHLSLLRFALDHLVKKGFIPVQPPYLMRREPYEGVVSLNDFEDVMYKAEGEELYMIATSEHPLVSQYAGEKLLSSDLPLKFAGWSSCFRKEAGSHGKDTKGVFRVHQFDKVEQVVFCQPEDSWQIHEELIANTEEIFKLLEIPYRIVNVCTGDIGSIAAKKYDLEAWMPAQSAYREMASCSNCTDYQSRSLGIRFGRKDGPAEGFENTLNNTGLASPRALACFLENHQSADGSVRIPRALRPYVGKDVIEFDK